MLVAIYCMKKKGKSLTTITMEKGGTPATKGGTATRKAATIYPSEPQAVSAMTEAGASSSVSASQSKAQTVSVAVKARDAQKMSRAAELLEAWKLDPSELVYGDKVGAGGQADVYLGRWQVSSRTSQPISPPAASVRKPIPTSLAGAARRDQEAA